RMPHRGAAAEPARGSERGPGRDPGPERRPAGAARDAGGGGGDGGAAAGAPEPGGAGSDLVALLRGAAGPGGDAPAGAHPRLGRPQRAAERACEAARGTGPEEGGDVSDGTRDGEDEFAGWEEVSLDDPRVRAWGPAARARLRAYQSFMAGEAPE